MILVGVVTARAGVKVPDNQKIFLGTGNDFRFITTVVTRMCMILDQAILKLASNGD